MIRLRGPVELLFSDGIARAWGIAQKEGEFSTKFTAPEPVTVVGVMFNGSSGPIRQHFKVPKQLNASDVLSIQLPVTCGACDGTGKFEVFARRRLAGETL